MPPPKMLEGKTALVTGASRGVGKGIALALGEAGATVFVTGRTRRGEDGRLPGSVDVTAEEITRRGGQGVPLTCDHADDAQVERVFEHIDQHGGGLDVLVNNAFALPHGPLFDTPFWQQPIAFWDVFQGVGLRSHYVASVFAARRMTAVRKGLIVHVSSFGGDRYAINVAYGVAKCAVDRLARDMAVDLEPHAVTSVSLWPGIVRTERLLAMAEASPFDLSKGESPEFAGRAVVALANDPGVIAKTGSVLTVADLAEEYGFSDVDGTRPRAFSKRKPRAL